MPPTPKNAYFICATPRSGSTLLCDLLARTEVAGHPESYFRRQSIPYWVEHLRVPSDRQGKDPEISRAYVSAVKQEGASRNGLFGARIMWESMPELSGHLDLLFPELPNDTARLHAAFGDAVYIYLSRKDKISQAVSLAKAMQTGLWHLNSDGSELERTESLHPSGYDFGFLDACFRELTANDRAWRDWFQRERVDPVRTTYEALALDPQAELSKVLEALGQDPQPANRIEVGTAKLADEESRQWIERFRSEKGLT